MGALRDGEWLGDSLGVSRRDWSLSTVRERGSMVESVMCGGARPAAPSTGVGSAAGVTGAGGALDAAGGLGA